MEYGMGIGRMRLRLGDICLRLQAEFLLFMAEAAGEKAGYLQRGSVSEQADRRPLTDREKEELATHYMNDYGNAMLRLAYSYVHNYEDAEDIMVDAVMKMLSANPRLENERHEKAYLMTIVANLSKNRIDYNKLRDTDELNEELVAEQREDLSFVWEAVKKLPDRYREVVHLFYAEGYSSAEIARILGRKDATVRSDLARGRACLKGILKEDYDFE